MKVGSYRRSKIYEFVWPQKGDLPDTDKIRLKCKRLSTEAQIDIEDSMIRLGSRNMSPADLANVPNIGALLSKMELTIPQAASRWKKIDGSVTDWSNVFDDSEPPAPIEYSPEALRSLAQDNFDLPGEKYGYFEMDLVAEIDKRNSLPEIEVKN